MYRSSAVKLIHFISFHWFCFINVTKSVSPTRFFFNFNFNLNLKLKLKLNFKGQSDSTLSDSRRLPSTRATEIASNCSDGMMSGSGYKEVSCRSVPCHVALLHSGRRTHCSCGIGRRTTPTRDISLRHQYFSS
jgi:hypothetical protein